MSEQSEQYGETARQQVLSAEERLVEDLKDIRFSLLAVGEKLGDRMAALDALKVAQAKLTKLIEENKA